MQTHAYLQILLPISQVVVVIRQALSKEVAVTQVTRLEVVQPLDELDARRAVEAAGAAGGHRLRRVLGAALTPLVPPARGGGGLSRLETRAGLAVAPGERRGAVGHA